MRTLRHSTLPEVRGNASPRLRVLFWPALIVTLSLGTTAIAAPRLLPIDARQSSDEFSNARLESAPGTEDRLSLSPTQQPSMIGRDVEFEWRTDSASPPTEASFEVISAPPADLSCATSPTQINARIRSIEPTADPGTWRIAVRVDASAEISLHFKEGTEISPPVRVTSPLAATETDGEMTVRVLDEVQPPTQLVDLAPIDEALGTDPQFLPNPVQIPAGERSSGAIDLTDITAQSASSTYLSSPLAYRADSPDDAYDGLVVTMPCVPFAEGEVTKEEVPEEEVTEEQVTEEQVTEEQVKVTVTKEAYIDVSDGSSPESVAASGTRVPQGTLLAEGQPICFIYAVTNTSPAIGPLPGAPEALDANTVRDIRVIDSDTSTSADGLVGTISTLVPGEAHELHACTVLIPQAISTGDE